MPREKGIPAEKVLGAIEAAIAAAYKKEYRKRSEIIRAKFNLKTGDVDFSQVKLVVDPAQVRIVSESEEEEQIQNQPPMAPGTEEKDELPRYNPDRHIFLEDAKRLKRRSN